MKVERKMEICAAHRLLGYDGKCENLHGHNYIITLVVEDSCHLHTGTGNYGMFVDFKDIKAKLSAVEENWDHKVLLHRDDPLLPILKSQGQACVAFPNNPTAENMVMEIARFMHALGIFGINTPGGSIDTITVSVEETLNNTATETFKALDLV